MDGGVNTTELERHCETATRLYPASLHALAQMQLLCERRRDHACSVAVLDEWRRIDNSVTVLRDLALLHTQWVRADQHNTSLMEPAIIALHAALARLPNDTDLSINLAMVLATCVNAMM